MPIEFHCPGCGQLVRTPDATAGRKGRCPHCRTKVRIPNASLTDPATPAAAPATRPSSKAAVSGPLVGGAIQFPCMRCGHTLRVPADAAGKQGRCPNCGLVETIPASRPPRAAPAGNTKWKGAPPRSDSSAHHEFPCPSCGARVRVPAAAAGGKGKCPRCGSIFTIPHPGQSARPSVPGLTPLEDAEGLMPLPDSSALEPQVGGGTDDLFADLPPPGPSPAFDPLGGAGGLTPLPASGAPARDGGTSSINPYASPRMLATSEPTDYGSRAKSGRRGLPWENPEHADAPFWGTIKLVLFSPTEAFSIMRRTGGLGRPLLFCVSGSLVGGLGTCLYYAILIALAVVPAAAKAGGPETGAPLVTLLLVTGAGLLGGLAVGIVAAIAGAFVNAALMHLFLGLVGGEPHAFETSFRVVCYSLGATAICQLIPCGALIGAVANIAILIHGLAAAHGTTRGKAASAVILPMVVCCMVCGTLFSAVNLALNPRGV